MTMFDCVWLSMTMYDYVDWLLNWLWLCLTMFENVYISMTMYDYIWHLMSLYDYVWQYMTIFDNEWPYMTMYDYVCLCMWMIMDDYRWL